MAPAMAASASPAGRQRQGKSSHAGRGPGEPVIVHLRDTGSGDMEVFAGTRQARLRDPEVAARLLRAIR
jgi:hypothetical protein